MSNHFILYLDDNYDYVTKETYEAVVRDEIEALMTDGYDASSKMYEILRKDPDVTLFSLLYGDEEEQKKAREAVEKVFREEAEGNVLSDWIKVILTTEELVDILRELGAATVNTLVEKAFG